jgi:cell division protein FtsI/penicillin-binding protein 2
VRALAPLLDESEGKLQQLLTPRTRPSKEGPPVPVKWVALKRKVPIETWEKIEAMMKVFKPTALDKPVLTKAETGMLANIRISVFAEDDQLRVYPNKKLAAHVLGFATSDEKQVEDHPVIQLEGKEGIEFTFNKQLAGTRGWRVTETDRRKHELVSMREQDVEARNGLNVVLTIDSVIQHIAETALAEAMEKYNPISASALVICPRTGAILAMATLPNYDPNQYGMATDDERRNRVICDQGEPGSTFKIVVTSGALNDGVVRPTDIVDCERGEFVFAGRRLHDHVKLGMLTVEQVITKSSNIGAAKIGIKLGEQRLYDYIRDFGFGTRTGIPLQGEIAGTVHPLNKWSKVSIAQIPMGQGIAVTRLQMAMAMAALANKGILMRPMLVARLEDEEHRVCVRYEPSVVRRVVTEQAAQKMVTALKTVVGHDGTAAKAALEHYSVAGKTGTAQKVENGIYVRKYLSSFIGFFPADAPEVCISVVLDEPRGSASGYYGGLTAAPVFKEIAEKAANYLNIRPEDNPQNLAPEVPLAAGGKSTPKTPNEGREP